MYGRVMPGPGGRAAQPNGGGRRPAPKRQIGDLKVSYQLSLSQLLFGKKRLNMDSSRNYLGLIKSF